MSRLTLYFTTRSFTFDFAHKIIVAVTAKQIVRDRSSRPEVFCKFFLKVSETPALEYF